MRRFPRISQSEKQPLLKKSVQRGSIWTNAVNVVMIAFWIVVGIAVIFGIVSTIVSWDNLSNIKLGEERDMDLMEKVSNFSDVIKDLEDKDASLTASALNLFAYVSRENMERSGNDTLLDNQLSTEQSERAAGDTSVNTTICDKLMIEESERQQKETAQAQAIQNFTDIFFQSIEGTIFNNTVCLVTLRSNIQALKDKDINLSNSFDMVDMLLMMIQDTGMSIESLLMTLTSNLDAIDSALDALNALNDSQMMTIMSTQSLISALQSDLAARLEAFQPDTGMKVLPNMAQTVIISGGVGYTTSASGNTVTITRVGVNQILGNGGGSVPALGAVTLTTATPSIVSFFAAPSQLTINTVDMNTQRQPGEYLTTNMGGDLTANWKSNTATYTFLSTDEIVPTNLNSVFFFCPFPPFCPCGGSDFCLRRLNVYTVPAGLCVTTYKMRLRILEGPGGEDVIYPLRLKGNFYITQNQGMPTDIYNNECAQDFYLTATNEISLLGDDEVQTELTCISILGSSENVEAQWITDYGRSITGSSPAYPFEVEIDISSNCLE